MGANVSDRNETSESSTKKGGVIAFHSSSKWRIYFEASKQTSKLIVIDFTASWCGPCRYMEPAINEFAEKYSDAEFIKIDVDELDDVAQEFGVKAMPTFLLIKKGKEVDKLVGAKKDDLQKMIEKHRI
ncbi:Thioredoxin H2 [Forsythia ovata]|uniref:Thioredoxin H2 n=1 Tax=Forsythia ovata TaxID=205694 RepID=A0ABD1TCB8_9LAMI